MKTRDRSQTKKACQCYGLGLSDGREQSGTALGPAIARKTAQSSLKIEGLKETGFRAHMSAATLKRHS